MESMTTRTCAPWGRNAGFTLVELMIVVGIIGLVAAMAMPSFMKSRQKARVNATVNDLRIFYDAFQQYAMVAGNLSSNAASPGVLPPYMAPYISSNKWSRGPEVGGQWYYKSSAFGALSFRPALGIVASAGVAPDPAAMLAIDQTMDNGDLTSGMFVRLSPNAYYLYLDM